ncbi:MAG: hypothetical protein HY940_01205 [Gammaproteobacteria bacterium]|nr:hypothetical protein [Gammaproteobacteria bacterium]
MTLQLLRGQVNQLTPAASNGEMDCILGKYKVKIHGDLARYVGIGDEILVACHQKNDTYHTLAARNIDTSKTMTIDLTNNILLMLGSGFISMMGFAVAPNAEFISSFLEFACIGLGLIGLVGLGLTIRQVFLINRAGAWVRTAAL